MLSFKSQHRHNNPCERLKISNLLSGAPDSASRPSSPAPALEILDTGLIKSPLDHISPAASTAGSNKQTCSKFPPMELASPQSDSFSPTSVLSPIFTESVYNTSIPSNQNPSSVEPIPFVEMSSGPSSPCSEKSTSQTNVLHLRPKRRRASTCQVAVLNAVFAHTYFPSTDLRERLGRQLGMSARSVQIWFQNKRQQQRLRRKHQNLNADPKSEQELRASNLAFDPLKENYALYSPPAPHPHAAIAIPIIHPSFTYWPQYMPNCAMEMPPTGAYYYRPWVYALVSVYMQSECMQSGAVVSYKSFFLFC